MKTNIVYIVLDDCGYADLGCYGSEIATPHMDRLADRGLRYSQFCAPSICSPSRACLLTGRNHHAVGVGSVAHLDLGPEFPHTRGRIAPEAATLAEILGGRGYTSFAVGKWHLAPSHESTPAGPYDNWPLRKGFDRFYGFMEGSTDQYRPELVEDHHKIEPPDREDYHLSEDLVDRSIQYITDSVSVFPDRPFFLYLCLAAPHAPHQAPARYSDQYSGMYDEGWDEIRRQRFLRQKELGLVPQEAELTARNADVRAWDELSVQEQTMYARFQEVYAGFLTHTDEQIGRLLAFLERIGELDNTLLVLLSDNGGSQEGGERGRVNQSTYFCKIDQPLSQQLASLHGLGGRNTSPNYPTGWAQVSNTPFQQYKQNTHMGGVQVPFIVHWPARLQSGGEIRRQFHHAVDVTPTVLDVLDIKPPDTVKGVAQMAMHGVSMAYSFDEAAAPSRRTTQYFYTKGHRAIYHDGWKAVTLHEEGASFEQDVWELYHLRGDFTESRDVSAEHPDKLAELKERWWEEAGRFGALPMTEKAIDSFGYDNPASPASRKRFVFYPGMGHLGAAAAPKVQNRSHTITARVRRPDSSCDGVLLAVGNHNSGYTLYVRDSRLIYEYNYYGEMASLQSEAEVPTGDSELSFAFEKTGRLQGYGRLYIDGRPSGSLFIPATMAKRISHEGLDIGKDSKSPVSPNYGAGGGFPFGGVIDRVVVEILE